MNKINQEHNTSGVGYFCSQGKLHCDFLELSPQSNNNSLSLLMSCVAIKTLGFPFKLDNVSLTFWNLFEWFIKWPKLQSSIVASNGYFLSWNMNSSIKLPAPDVLYSWFLSFKILEVISSLLIFTNIFQLLFLWIFLYLYVSCVYFHSETESNTNVLQVMLLTRLNAIKYYVNYKLKIKQTLVWLFCMCLGDEILCGSCHFLI